MRRIGFLRAAGPNEKDFNAFRSGLRALGYIEGENIVIEQRYAAGAYHLVGELAADLVRLNMDVIVVDGPAAAKPAKAATADIPIVFALATDPVADDLVTSMARPGANLTGLTLSVGYQLAGKRVELLKDIKPDLARLAVLKNPDQPSASFYLSEAEKAGRALGLTMRTFDARIPGDLPAAFAAMVEWRADGVITLNDGMLYSQRERVVTLARENRLGRSASRDCFRGGGRPCFIWPEPARSVSARATYVDKILKGAKPADLPIEQPTQIRAGRQSQDCAERSALRSIANSNCAPTR